MNQATPAHHHTLNGATSRRKAVIIIVIVVIAIMLMSAIALGALFPPSVKISPDTDSREVPTDTDLKISTSWMRGDIKSVEVKETSLDPMGADISERTVNGHLENGVFVSDDGQPLRPDARYEITVSAELRQISLSGIESEHVTEQVSFYTIITPAPLFTDAAQVVEFGEPFIIEFNTPIEDFSYSITPELQTTYRIDDENPTRALIAFEGYEQGQSFSLSVTGATAENGALLQKEYSQVFVTTEPLKVVFVPGDGESAVALGTRPTLTFTEAVRNPEAAESLLTIEPATLGSWEWITSDIIEFKPLQNWVQGTQVTIRLKGGTEALRGESGSFLREDVSNTFTTKPSKLIDVNLATQTVTLFDNDQQVRSMLASSGSKATPSLTGTYAVYAKAEKLDMEGEGYRAEDVPWVLMFNGDYTIHGNYWSTTFGVPSSHGCVGLPVPDAEYLYNWAPIGTIVSIHY